MAKNKVTRNFTDSGSWTAPAGVTSVRVKTYLTLIKALAGSAASSGVIDPSGRLWTFGQNANGQLGIGSVSSSSIPLEALNSRTFRSAVEGGQTAMGAVDMTNKAYLAGANLLGGLGIGSTTPTSSPVAVQGGVLFSMVVASHGSSGPTLGIGLGGQAYAWGQNDLGQLGVGDITNRSFPALVSGGLGFLKLAANNNKTCYGLTNVGTLWAWGNSNAGSLGNGTTTPPVSVPTAVVGVDGLVFQDISVGLALTSSGAAYAWGDNAFGQLGDGTVTDKTSPVPVIGGKIFTKIFSGGGGFSAGLDANGQLWTWGRNTNGELGDGTIISKSSPVAVLGSHIFIDASLGANHSLAMTENGEVYSWGLNGSGQLGLGDTTPRSSPVAIPGLRGLCGPKLLFDQDFSVTPGNSYSVLVGRDDTSFGYGTFDGNPVGLCPDLLTLEWFA